MMAWLALAIIAILTVVAFLVRSIVQRVRTGDSGLRRDALKARPGSAEWFGAWLLVVAVIAAIAAPIAELTGLTPWIESTPIRVAGAIVAIVGTVLVFVAQMNMGDDWRIGVDPTETTHLVTTGAFQVVRNPIFSAFLVTATGLTIMVCNPISLVGLALFVIAIELQVRFVEEPYLMSTHPTSYRAYASRVGRFIPLVGRLHATARINSGEGG